MQINDNIKKARELTGLSQADFAYIIGVGRSTYAEWEGQIIPRAHFFSRISAVSGVSMDDILETPADHLEKIKQRAVIKGYTIPDNFRKIIAHVQPGKSRAAAAKILALQELIIEFFSDDGYKKRSKDEIRAALGSKVHEILDRKDEMDTLSDEDK